MLSYQHIFHAGNSADVIKHITLSLIIESLLKKETPICYLDTHAGSGLYDLHSPHALKHAEFQHGIARIWNQRNTPAELTPYLAAIKACNQADHLRFYPGSPVIAQHLLRKHDRLILCELHSNENKKLETHFAHIKQAAVHYQNGYVGLKAFLPPPEKRGLVLIDPAFELADEPSRFTQALITAAQRFPTGIILGWFPMLDKTTPVTIERTLRDSLIRNILSIALLTEAPREQHFYGSTLIVINPPWQLDDKIKKIAPWLLSKLTPDGQGQLNIQWIVPE